MSVKSQNPFDFSEYFAQIDPKTVFDQWQKAFGQAQLPQVDTKALFETQSKNLYALISANQAVMAGARNLMQRQGELMQEAMEEATKAMQDMGSVTDPGDAAVKQTEMVQAAFEKALANSKEISELIATNYQEAADAINERFNEALNEIKTAIAKNK